jgi:hypothetical protein
MASANLTGERIGAEDYFRFADHTPTKVAA